MASHRYRAGRPSIGRAGRPPLLLHVFPTFAVGGSQSRFASVANHFGTAWRHALVAIDGDNTCRERLRPALIVDFLAVPVRKDDPLGNILRYRRLLRDLAPDVLVTHNWGSIEWAAANALVGVRHVHIEDGFGPEERARQLPRRIWTRRLLLRRATVVLPSRTLYRIATEVWRLDPRGVRYIPNGIDLARFATQPASHGADEPIVIGTVAALRPEKNVGRLLRAFALLQPRLPAGLAPPRLIIAGDGPQRAALQALARALGVAARVQFSGHVAAPQDVYRRLDVFALSSDTEQMPLSLLEAMAAGLPVAATDVGDVAAMLAEANRRCVVALDDAALAGALAALLSDAALRRSLGLANRARAERDYDQQAMFAAYAGLLVPGRPGTPGS